MILGNKIDKKGAVSMDELMKVLGIKVSEEKQRPVNVFMCSISNKLGYGEAFRWLGKYLK